MNTETIHNISVTDPILAGPGAIAALPADVLTGDDLVAENGHRIIACLQMLERELDDLPGEEHAHNWARFCRVFWAVKPMLETHFEGLNERNERLCAQLYAGESALVREIESVGESDPLDALSSFTSLFELVTPAMIQRCRDVIGVRERSAQNVAGGAS